LKIEALTLEYGDPRYRALVDPLRDDIGLAYDMLRDAESRLDDRPGDWMVIATVDGTPAAWRLLRPTLRWDGEIGGLRVVILVRNAYVRRGYRLDDIGTDVYELVHDTTQPLITRLGVMAESWVYEHPRKLMLADGWQDMPGQHGISTVIPDDHHEWWGMKWMPNPIG